jgi:hypothetical protein
MSTFEIVTATPDLAVIDRLSDAKKIAAYSKHLSPRETQQIITGFQTGSYEMVTSYVWIRATTVLRKELAKLGMEFVGEVLGRPDITDDSSSDEISETEAINLAENLGMVSSTEAMRLRQTQAFVNHFNKLEREQIEEEGIAMAQEEALACLKACIKNILGVPKIEFAEQFSKFRRDLEQKPFQPDDPQVEGLKNAPHFFRKTTLSFLLSSIKTSEGAQLQNALHNINVILPIIWKLLKKTELWQVGNVYAELYSNGQQVPVAGLKKALLKVNGFDYVPETTRSNTFTKAAAKLLAAHEGMNNFHKEGPAMEELASLGTTIPMPAFPVCSTAILAAFLGNQWGHSWAAEAAALKMLRVFSSDKWTFYLNECLPADSTILCKLKDNKPASRWCDLAKLFSFDTLQLKDPNVKQVALASSGRDASKLSVAVTKLLAKIGSVRS